MKKKLLFVFNPLSGRAQIKNNLLEIIDIFTKADYEITIRPTQCKMDAYEIIKKWANKCDLIVCCGGDGTLDEAVKALMQSPKRPFLGYIPSGTTNDFGYSLGLSNDMIKAAEDIVSGFPFSCDIGTFNGTYYSYVAAFGAFVDVSYQTPQSSKNVFGRIAYILEGLKRLSNIRTYNLTVTHDDEILVGEYVIGIVSNSISIGGYRKLNEMGVLLDDGLFEVTLIKKPKNALDLQSIISCLLKQDLTSPYIHSFRTSEVTISCDEELEWTLDGEDGGYHKKANIIANKQAINIIVPQKPII